MDEGVIVKEPKLFLIEYGECIIERRHELTVTHPLRRKEIISKQVCWLPICTVGPGTLLGEEILFYKRHEEKYENRVRVMELSYEIRTISFDNFT